MFRYVSILLTTLLPGIILPVVGQDIDRSAFRRFNVEEGLSQGSINAILQDHKGFIWIGTFDGLNRFDGTEFKVYRNDPADPRSLASNWIASLTLDADHTLWVKTDKGLERYDRATDSFVRVSSLHTLVQPVPLKKTPQLFLYGGPPLIYDPATDTVQEFALRRDDGTPFAFSPSLVKSDAEGFLWAMSESLLTKIDPGERRVLASYPMRIRSPVTMLPSRVYRDEVWVGSTTGLLRIQEGKPVSYGTFNVVASLAEDSRGRLWIGTYDGLATLDLQSGIASPSGRERVVSTSLSHHVVTSLLEDASGGIWIGTHNGLNFYDRFSPLFLTYTHSPHNPQSVGSSFVLPIAEDHDGNIWFGTFGAGVSVLRGRRIVSDKFVHYRHNPGDRKSLRSDNVRSLLCARDGRIWIGNSKGLNIYDPAKGEMTSFISEPDVPAGWVESLCESADGSIWFVFGNHLIRLDGARPDMRLARRYAVPAGAEVVFMTEGRNGILWMATSVGLLGFNPHTGAFLQYTHDPGNPKSLSNNWVWGVHQDPDDTTGMLWVGTSRGLNKLNPETGECIRYLEQEGFPNSCVYGILEDDLRRLWLSTNEGLVLFDDTQPEGRKFRNFTHEDGVAGNEFNRRSFCRLRNGEFLFGGPNGVTRFHPVLVRDNPTVPPFVMTGFYKLGKRTVFEKDIADVRSIELNHDENVFSFEFAALNYSNPSKSRYAYMMEGIDKEWIHAGSRRSVNYAYVPSGEYVFRVKASHISGVWNDNELAVQLRIHPPFWATWWFMALVVLSLSGAIAASVRARVHRLLEIERLRTRIARDLHDEIGSNLSSIAVASDLLKRRQVLGENEHQKLSEISSVALNTVKDMKDIVWLIKPGNNSIDDLFLRMKDAAAAILDGCQYSLRFPEAAVGRKVNLDWRQHVYLIYKVALTNIARHALASRVAISVDVEEDRLTLNIVDDGKGFAGGSVIGGNGLKNMRERAELLKAELQIDSMPAGGTSICLTARIT